MADNTATDRITLEEARQLRPGDAICVRFGGFGTQRAEIIRASECGRAFIVRKWRAKSKRWTKPVSVVMSEVIGRM